MVELIIAGTIGAGLALLIGWLLWGRPLGVTRAERDTARAERDSAIIQATEAAAEASRQREERGRNAVEVTMLTDRLAQLATAETDRETLVAQLAAVEATRAERDRAHAAEIARTAETFQRLAAGALETAQTKLAESAEALMLRQREAAGQGLEANRHQLAELIAPVRDTLVKYETRLGEVEAARTEAYGSLKQQLAEVALGQDRVSGAAARLETALRSSGKVAGRWGEEQCRNVLEGAGLVEGIDFEAQWSTASEDGHQQRPDFRINLPGGRALIIDVKCSVDAYVSAAEAQDPAARAGFLAAHARAVRTHADGLAKKDYAKAVGGAAEFVVLFVPGENFLGAAMEQDRTLLNDFFNRNVLLAGPINLVAVARTMAALRDQARLAREAAEIAKLGRDLYESITVMTRNFAAMGKSLGTSVRAWNELVKQANGRLLSRAERLKDKGAATGLADLTEINPIDELPALEAAADIPLLAVRKL